MQAEPARYFRFHAMKIQVRIALFASLVLSQLLWATPIYANGVTNVELFRKEEGAYQLAVFSRDATSTVGEVLLSVHLLRDNAPVEAAEVVARSSGPEGSSASQAAGEIAPTLPIHYDLRVPVDAVGDWDIEVVVQVDETTLQGEFPIRVVDAEINWEVVGAILVAVLLILPALAATYRSLRTGRKKG